MTIATLAIRAFFIILWSVGLARAQEAVDRPFVHEVTVATPDIIAIEVRDPPYRIGRLVQLPGPRPEQLGQWVQHEGKWGLLVGRNRDHVRLEDTPPAAYLDRPAVDRATDYVIDGGPKVVSVYRKSVPYDTGVHRGAGGEILRAASFKHFIYLKLDRDVPMRSPLVVHWPSSTLPDTSFTIDPSKTRAIALRANQVGYAPKDPSKSAFLSLWLPGGPNEGVVDFGSYGLKTFNIVDNAGTIVFRGDIALRRGPMDPEMGNGLPQPTLEYASASSAPLNATARLEGSEIVLVAAGHRFKAGQRVWLYRFGNAFAGINGFHTVVSVTSDQVRIKLPEGVQVPPVTTGAGTIGSTYRANRAGTFVYELNFDQWSPVAGQYRIEVPRLGMSDPFTVSDDVWLRAARVSFGGLYNHHSGVELDGRFGFRRPASFRPGQTVELVRSRLPLAFAQDEGGFVEDMKGGKKPWVIGKAGTENLWGGYMDAGDYDRRSQHLAVSYMLLDLYEGLPDSIRRVSLGLPKSSETLDPTLYAGTDQLPDLLHEAIWNIDFFRRMQLPTGDVLGGIESDGGIIHGTPSYLESNVAFAFGPDIVSSYRYAESAAKLARILSGEGQNVLAKLYSDSATAAWRAAEAGLANPDRYFAEAIAVANEAGFAGGWAAKKDHILRVARDARLPAAVVLYRLTGETAYRAVFEDMVKAGNLDTVGHTADALWEYYTSDKPVDEGLRNTARDVLLRQAKYVTDSQQVSTFPTFKHFYAPMGWGQGASPDIPSTLALIRAHRMVGNPAVLKAMLQGSSHVLGANPSGLSFTIGLGARNVRHPLHEDHFAMGVPAPPGITIYAWSTKEQADFGWLFGPFWSGLPEGPDKRERANLRQVEPNRWTLPLYEFLIEHPQVIPQQEYTIHQTIGTTAAMWLYLYSLSVSR